MYKTTIAALLSLSLVGVAAGAHAQDGAMKPTDGSTMSTDKPAMSSSSTMSNDKMSDADMKSMQMCQGMSNDDMMKNKKCMAMMKAHPDMMKSK